ncbi:MAG: IS200/IS605 family transposase [Euryarchaeota archaeon]|nr:IS200/IS605 family transposase [Euryarchaeota archaeon]
MVITPKYRGKILVEDVALAVEGIIRTTCKEMEIEIIDMAVNVDHVHLFIEYPPKYSVRFIAKKIKGRSSRILRQNFPQSRENGAKIIYGLPDVIMALWVLDGRLWRNISGRKIVRERANCTAQALYLSAGIVTSEGLYEVSRKSRRARVVGRVLWGGLEIQESDETIQSRG